MSARPRTLAALVLGLVLTLLVGCGSDGSSATDRDPGDPISEEEADTLAGLLHRDFTEGGADFTVTAPYAEDTVLTLTGEVDFRSGTSRSQAVTTFGDGRPDDSRTLFATTQDL